MKTNDEGRNLIKEFERCMLDAYPDPASELAHTCRKNGIVIYEYFKLPDWKNYDGKPWTIGWGHTGPDVAPGVTWTQERADKAFDVDLNDRELMIARLAKAHNVPRLTPDQFAALVSFVYNCGFNPAKNLFRNCVFSIDDGTARLDPQSVAQYLNMFAYSHGVMVPGLARRRREEADLFLRGCV